MPGYRDRADDGLLTLLGDVPQLVRNLVTAEVQAAKTWIARTAKDAGIGSAWFAVALFALFWAIPLFGTFLVALLSLWLPLWASALILFGVFLLLVIAFALLGVGRMRRIGRSENPVQAVTTDVRIVKDVADEL